MIGGHCSCAIHNGSDSALGVPGELFNPARISRTSRREQPSARAISRTPRPSESRRSISAYRSTVNILRAMSPSRSCQRTTVQGTTALKAARRRWAQSEEIGWVQSQEIRWVQFEEIGGSQSEEILHFDNQESAIPPKAIFCTQFSKETNDGGSVAGMTR